MCAAVEQLTQTSPGGVALRPKAAIIATLLVVALPAHAFVVGFTRARTPSARTVDTALLKRIGAWLASAAGITALRALMGL